MHVEKTVTETITCEDPPDGSHLTVDPYDGCTIGCPYCFQREDPAWSAPIVVKTNLPELLRDELTKHPVTGDVYIGSRCDPYMPMEAHYKLTRSCLSILSDFHVPTFICTKADPDLIYRDWQILKTFQAGLTVVLGLTNLAQILRAGNSSTIENIELAGKLNSEGITVLCFVTPVLPGITDVHAILDALPVTVPLWLDGLQMSGKNRAAPQFLSFVAEHYPKLAESYRQMIYGAPNNYYNGLLDEFKGNERIKFPFGQKEEKR
jgi:DNA repair photolyase